MPCNFTIEYQPGQANGVDFLSRSKSLNQESSEDYVKLIASTHYPVAIPASKICAEQDTNRSIGVVKEAIMSGQL